MEVLRKSGDSCGAKIKVVARGVPVGRGEPLFDKLDADIAWAMMGLNAVKGVEIGAGFEVITQKGSEHGDELTPEGFLSNNAGGILGGISTGQDVVVTIGIKPTEPATGYGYIQTGNELPKISGVKTKTTFFKAERFVEKPNFETALQYVNSGQYRWNAGMFIWSFVTIANGLEKHQPEMFAACQRWFKVTERSFTVHAQARQHVLQCPGGKGHVGTVASAL